MAFSFVGNKVQSLRIEEATGEITAVNPATAKFNESRQNVPENLSSFMEATTLHGARFLFTGNVFRRLLWAVALISCFSVCIYQVYLTVDAFGHRPFNTKITTKTPDKDHLPFPAVTLCNFNFFSLRKFVNHVQKEGNWSREEVELKLQLYGKLMSGSQEAFTNQSITNNPELTWRHTGEDYNDHYLVLFSPKIDEMLLPSSLFKSCIISGVPCGSKNFTSFYNSVFGQCYTFNSGQDDRPIINATMAGHLNGLKLLLNIDRDNYLENPANPYVGFTVLVHDQKDVPFMEQFGFAVEPGVRTLCAIKRKKVINLEKPHATNCTNRSLEMFTNTTYTYSKPACLMECLGHFVVKQCGCRPLEYKDLNVPICAPNDTFLCMLPQYEAFGASEDKEKCEKSCPQPCNYTEYETSLSYAGLQRNVFIKKFNSAQNITENFAVYKHFLNLTESEKKDYIDENIISMNIYFKDLSYDEFEQTPQFEIWTLISSLGGNFGLFLGMSILTVLEFIDFTFRRICFFFWKN